ncbi:MAG: MFS transporter [Proteobacteria bacterium]|nr:MFS transporter [Pseudomonadota bacterium]
MKSNKGKSGFYGWRNSALLFCTYFIGMGLVYYAYPILFPAMIKASGWGRGEASVAHTLRMVMAAVTTPLAAILVRRYGGRNLLRFGLTMMLVGIILLGTCISELWHWIAIWGFVMPFAFSFGGLIPHQTTITMWFSKKRATAIGFIMTGAGLGGFLAQPYYAWLIEHGISWETGWISSSGFLIVGLVLTHWIKSKPEDLNQYPDGLSPEEAQRITERGEKVASTYRTDEIWALRECLKTRTVWFGMVVKLTQTMSLALFVAHGVLHLTDLNYTQMQAAAVTSAMLLGSTTSRFPCGVLADLIEARWILSFVMILMLSACIIFWQAPSFTLLITAGFVYGLCYGTILVLVPTAIGNYWGPNNFASIIGIMAPCILVFGAPVAVWAGYIYDYFGSYDLAFLIICIVLIIGFLCAFALKPPNQAQGKGYLPFCKPGRKYEQKA